MTQINNLILFKAGTKALASEINSNFEILRCGHNDHDSRMLASEASINSNSTDINLMKDIAVNIKNYGAVGNGIHDDYIAINDALTEVAGKYPLYFPEGTYLVGTKLDLPSGTHIIGASRDNVIVREHTDLGSNQIFHIQGTSETHKTNITIENITIRNGTATTGAYTAGKEGIRAEYIDGLTVKNCKITEIQGVYGIVAKYCTDILIQKNHTYRCTYAHIALSIECENARILDNICDTVVSTNYSSCYLITTGAETLNEGTFFIKNVWIERNKCLNNPLYEGIDSHGGENVWIRDNYVENCSEGIDTHITAGYVSDPQYKNYYIVGNKLYKGTATVDGHSITAIGYGDGTIGGWYKCTNINIIGNYAEGFGMNNSGNQGSIIAYYIGGNLTIRDNTIKNSINSGITLYVGTLNATIKNNNIANVILGSNVGGGTTAGIWIQNGCYNVIVDDNTITYDDITKAPLYGIRGNSSSPTSHVKVGINNKIDINPSQAASYQIRSLNHNFSANPTAGFWRYGDMVYDVNSGLYKKVQAANGFYGWLAYATTVDATAGDYKARVINSSTSKPYNVPPCANVVIAGAGAAGANLTTQVIKTEMDGTLTLKDAIATTVTSAAITMVAPTFVS